MNIQPLSLLIVCLAAWRLSSLLSREEGPFDMFGKFRARIGVRYTETSLMYGTNFLSSMVVCMYCNSIWLGIALTVCLWLLPDTLVTWLCLPFSISAVAIVIEELTQK